jgi:hypothetical protein
MTCHGGPVPTPNIDPYLDLEREGALILMRE